MPDRPTTPASEPSAPPPSDPISYSETNLNPRNTEDDDDQQQRIPSSAKGKGKGKAEIPAEPRPQPSKGLELAAQQKQRKAAEREELQRIIRLVEADKAERRARQQRGRDAMNQPSTKELRSAKEPSAKHSQSKGCHIQIRLFDGSTIRTQFFPTATLHQDVRPWISSALGSQSLSSGQPKTAKIPHYTFKQILAPLPSRALTDADENESLATLGLPPSATLVLVSTSNTVNTANATLGGTLDTPYRLFAMLYALLAGWIQLIVGMLGNFAGGGRVDQAQPITQVRKEQKVIAREQGETTATASSPRGEIRIRTLRDRKADKEPEGPKQFYNGNQVCLFLRQTNSHGDSDFRS